MLQHPSKISRSGFRSRRFQKIQWELQVYRTGFTPSGAPVQKKIWGPYYMNTSPPDCLYPTRTVVIIDILLRTRAAHYYWPCTGSEPSWLNELATREHWTLWQSMMPARYTKSFPLFSNHYFNISGLLPCCKKWKKMCAFVGPPFCGSSCSAEHAEHA